MSVECNNTRGSEPEKSLLGPYRIFDLSDERGALCGSIFAALGANVIQIEPPEGSSIRRLPPFYNDVPDVEGSFAWWALGAGKRSVCMDLHKPKEGKLFIRLIETADFLIESFAPGYMAELGFGFEDLQRINPRLILVSITPYGQTGPHSRWEASDLNIQGMGGHMYLMGDVDRSPVRVGIPASYWHGGSEAAAAALIAHHYRRWTGRGQHVDISMQQCVIWTLLNTTMTWQLVARQEMRGGSVRKERGNTVFTRVMWQCEDGLVYFVPIGGGGGKSRSQSYLRFVDWMREEGHDSDILTFKDWNHHDMFNFNQDEYDLVADGPFRDDKPGINKSGFYADFNSSKYSLSLNLKRPETHEIAKRLIMWADVVAESFTPRVMSGWGLGYSDIVELKPEVIMISSCMQGQTGPYRFYSGYGGQATALSGLHYLTGWPDRDPSGPKGAYTDAVAPRYAVASILAALEYRERTGLGQHIDLSQIEATISGFLGTEILDYTVNGRVAERQGTGRHDSLLMGRSSAKATTVGSRSLSRRMSIGCDCAARWKTRDCRLIPLYMTVHGRLARQNEIENEISEWTRDRDAFETVELLQRAGVAAGVVQKAVDLFSDVQLSHRNHFRPLDHVEMGRTSYSGPAHDLSESPAVLKWAAPLLGEHTTYHVDADDRARER